MPRPGLNWVTLVNLRSYQMSIIIQIQSKFYPILLILFCLFLVLVIKHWLINCLSMFITTFLLIILPFILSKSNTILAKLYTNIDFQHLQKKKKLATPEFEPWTEVLPLDQGVKWKSREKIYLQVNMWIPLKWLIG